MSNPASRSGKLLIWYLPANDIHQKKEDLETSWKLRDWWNFLDLEIFVSIQNWFFSVISRGKYANCVQLFLSSSWEGKTFKLQTLKQAMAITSLVWSGLVWDGLVRSEEVARWFAAWLTHIPHRWSSNVMTIMKLMLMMVWWWRWRCEDACPALIFTPPLWWWWWGWCCLWRWWWCWCWTCLTYIPETWSSGPQGGFGLPATAIKCCCIIKLTLYDISGI